MDNIIKKRDNSVRKSNFLIQKSRHQLTLAEQKVILYVCSLIKPTDNEMEYEFSIADYISVCGISDGGKNYEDLKQTLKNLTTKKWELRFENSSAWHWVSWLNDLSGDDDATTFKVGIHKVLRPYLLDVSERFTDYRLVYVLGMSSAYAIQIYEILKSFAWTGKWVVSVEDFKKQLMLNDKNSYNLWGSVKQKVIDVAVKEINAYTDLSVEYIDNGGRGKKTTQMAFKIKLKNKEDIEQIKKQVNEMLDMYSAIDDEKVDRNIWDWLNQDEEMSSEVYHKEEIKEKKEKKIYLDKPSTKEEPTQIKAKANKLTSDYEDYTNLIKYNIEYDVLLYNHKGYKNVIDGIVDIMVDVLTSQNEMIRINKENRPLEVVKSRFLKLNNEHIDNLINKLKQNDTCVDQSTPYIITMLYNESVAYNLKLGFELNRF